MIGELVEAVLLAMLRCSPIRTQRHKHKPGPDECPHTLCAGCMASMLQHRLNRLFD